MAQQKPGGGGESVDSLSKKLADFASGLEREEQEIFTQLIEGGLAPLSAKGRPVERSIDEILVSLRANLLGQLRMRDDDDGFWAQWAQRQS